MHAFAHPEQKGEAANSSVYRRQYTGSATFRPDTCRNPRANTCTRALLSGRFLSCRERAQLLGSRPAAGWLAPPASDEANSGYLTTALTSGRPV